MVQKKKNKKTSRPFDPTGQTWADMQKWNAEQDKRDAEQEVKDKEEAKKKHEEKNPFSTSDEERFKTKRQATKYQDSLNAKKALDDAQERYNTRTATLEDINLLENKKVLTNVKAGRYRIEKGLNVEGSMEAHSDSSNVIPGHVPHYDIKKQKDKEIAQADKDAKKEAKAKLKKASEAKDKEVATRSATIKQHNMLKASYDKDYKAMEEIATWEDAKEEWDPVELEMKKTPAGWKPKKDLTPKEKADFDIKVQNLETKKKKLGSYIGPKEEATTPLHPKTKQPIKAFSF